MFQALYNRKTESLNGVWKYRIDQNDVGVRQSYYLSNGEEDVWKEIRVPHNWYLTEEIGDYFGTIWYTRKFEVPKEMKGKRVFLYFEGVDYISEVWLNGTYLGFHEGMFNSFEYDITSCINWEGENLLIVRDSAPKDTTEYIPADTSEVPMSERYKVHQSKEITQIKGHMIEAMHAQGITMIYGRQSCDTRKLEGEGCMDCGNRKFGGQEALVVFDRVFVPWNRVFLCEEYEFAGILVERFAGYHRQSYGGCKAGVGDVLIGAAAVAAELPALRKERQRPPAIIRLTICLPMYVSRM